MAGPARLVLLTGQSGTITALGLRDVASGDFHGDGLELARAGGGQRLVLDAAAFTVPAALIAPGDRIKTTTEIEAEAVAALGSVAAVFAKTRDEFRRTLMSLHLMSLGGARTFAGATLTIDAALDLALPATQGPQILLSIRTRAVVSAASLGELAFDLEVSFDEAFESLARPSVSLKGLPQLPPLQLRWPAVAWPTLDWSALSLGPLESLLRFDLPLPGARGGVPLRFVASTPGSAAPFTLSATNLSFDSGGPLAGTLVLDTTTIASVANLRLIVPTGAAPTLAGTITPAAPAQITPLFPADIPGPFAITIQDPQLLVVLPAIDLGRPATAGPFTATLTLRRVVVRARSDPGLNLALSLAYEQRFDPVTGTTSGKLTRLAIVEPYPLSLVALAANSGTAAAMPLIRLIARIDDMLQPGGAALAVLDRIASMAAAAVRWAADSAGAAADQLLGLAERVGEVLADCLRALLDLDRAVGRSVIIDVRLDSRDRRLRQIQVSRLAPGHVTLGSSAFGVTIPDGWSPSLLIDFGPPASVALIVEAQPGATLGISSDLWLGRPVGQGTVVQDAVRPAAAAAADPPLIELDIGLSPIAQQSSAIAIVVLQDGHLSLLRTVTPEPVTSTASGLGVVEVTGPISYPAYSFDKLTIKAKGNAKKLPFLDMPGGAQLRQYIEVDAAPEPMQANQGVVSLVFHARLHLDRLVPGDSGAPDASFDLTLELDLSNMQASIKGGDKVTVHADAPKDTDLYGLHVTFTPADDRSMFVLDFKSGDALLSLAPGAAIDAKFDAIAARGQGLTFKVSGFSVSRAGVDLDADVDADKPVTLAGVDMPFRFERAGLAIRRGQIQTFEIAGSGQLPKELIGEADASIAITLGPNGGGGLSVKGADAKLKTRDPIVSHATCFTLTLSAIGLKVEDFGADGGFHFYFTLTGEARFTPSGGGFAGGLLKNFGGITIKLDEAPLARDASRLIRRIEFQIAIEPKKTFAIFDLFTFELRGIGFRPSSPAFDGEPAISISGQVKFVEAGDIVSPKFDFHEMWIARPKGGDALPRIRFDGLTVGVRFGSTAYIEGTAIAVDGSLPTLYAPGTLPKGITAKGFLASGALRITGWGAMSASMGFLQVQDGDGPLRLAFFLYLRADELSIPIPTPLCTIYLRTVGFGLGFRFTLAAFEAVEQAANVRDLIAKLDAIARYQGDLTLFKAWTPEPKGDRLTLALNGLISINSASEETKYNAKGEKDLPNPVLLDVLVAFRSDLTFFMSARAWLGRNYADWHDSGPDEHWRQNPTLLGYMYLSVPRREFLGRLVADGTKADLDGAHPKLPAPLVKGMRNVKWSATLYIRPGLLHFEYGWPYELTFTFDDDAKIFHVDCAGGLVFRIEDDAMLYGIAFRATGYAKFGGSVGGRSFGASVEARADFSIDAKLIAYLSVRRFSDTLFYGVLALDVTISLSVRVWLDVNILFGHIHLEVGFALSLAISVALEVAVTPDKLGGRGHASVSVGGFGRSLTLGVGFGFNEGLLEEARLRVQRFLSLGLTVALPDAAQGVALPVSTVTAAATAVAADKAVEDRLDRQAAIAPLADAVTSAVGRPLDQSSYWAMLSPVPAPPGSTPRRYVLVFVPRDHSITGIEELDQSPTSGTFYPPRSPGGAAPLQLIWPDQRTSIVLTILKPDGGTSPATLSATQPLDLAYTDCTVADGATLFQILDNCFLGQLGNAREPKERPVKAGRHRLPDDRETAGQMLGEASRDQAALGAEERAANDIDERRSAVVASLCESATRLAADLTQPLAAGAIDPRSLGIAILVTDDDLNILFDSAVDGQPRRARFSLVAPFIPSTATQVAVHLFNPPERMFDVANPVLAAPVAVQKTTRVLLDWDIAYPFAPEQVDTGLWHSPEFNLKHYRIERQIERQGVLDGTASMSTTVKAAAPMRIDSEADRSLRQHIRPNAQYVDDVAAILKNGDARAIYTVIPVDVAGREGAGTPLVVDLLKSLASPELNHDLTVRRASITVTYTEIGVLGGPAVAYPRVTLGFDTAGPASAGHTTYLLRIRQERSFASGQYGADAVGEALARPSAADFAQEHPDDVTLKVLYRAPSPYDQPGEFPPPSSDAGLKKQLMRAMGIEVDGPRGAPIGVRFAMRPMGVEGAPWCVLDIAVEIGAPGAPAPPKVAATVEVFEHLLGFTPEPLPFEDIAGDAGRVLLLHPKPAADLLAWLSSDTAQDAPGWLNYRRDAARRVATKLRWNARPSGFVPGLQDDRGAYIGGFDLFEVDAQSLVQGIAASLPRHVARVQSLPHRWAALDPSEVTDFSKLAAAYPSTARLINAAPAAEGGRPAADAAKTSWYTPAESYVAWPKRTWRRSVGLDVEEGLLTRLFDQGRPDRLRVDLRIGALTSGNIDDRPELVLARHADGTEGSQADPGFTMAADNGSTPAWTIAAARLLLHDLVWRPRDDVAGETCQKLFKSDPSPVAFRDARLVITARRRKTDGNFAVLSSIESPVDLDPALHPILVDAIALASYVQADSTEKTRYPTRYRRYEPVLEPLPKHGATSLAELVEAAPAPRDPYGWGVLRALGLATGLRLFDKQDQAFVDGQSALPILAKGLVDALARYVADLNTDPDLDFGAPFVDVILPPGGTMTLASFDGGAPIVDDGRVRGMALAMTQLSLRPVANRLRGVGSVCNGEPVAYFEIKAGDDACLDIDLSLPVGSLGSRVLELIEITDRVAKPEMKTLLWTDGAPGRDVDSAAALLTGGDAFPATLHVDTAARTAWLARITVTNGNAAAVHPDWLKVGRATLILAPGRSDADPFGLFPDMERERFAALCGAGGANGWAGHPAMVTMASNLRALVRRRWPTGWPDTSRAEADIIERLPDWTRRFLENGPAAPIVCGSRAIPFAIAEVTLPEPWRVGIDGNGRLEVLLLADNRRQQERRYAVQPFGRYDAILAGENGSHMAPPTLRWTPPPILPAALPPAVLPPAPFADIVLPRTQSIGPVRFVAARLVDVGVNDKVQEFLLAAPLEQGLSSSNAVVDKALSYEGFAIALLRKFAFASWSDGLGRTDYDDALGDFTRYLPPPAPAQGRDGFGGLSRTANGSGRYPEGYLGVTAIRLRELPWFFRLTAVAYAAAGVVVSKVVSATVPEGASALRPPWTHGREPIWSIVVTPVSGNPDHVGIVFRVPLVSLADGMSDASAALWLSDHVPEAFRIPDPTARYRIEISKTKAVGPTTLVARSGELDLTAIVGQGQSRFGVKSIGPLFPPPAVESDAVPISPPGRPAEWYINARVTFIPRQEPSADFAPLDGAVSDASEALYTLQLNPNQFLATAWRALRPIGQATLTVTRPVGSTPAAWAAFSVATAGLASDLRQYAPEATALAAATLLDGFAAADEAWWRARFGGAPISTQVLSYAAGLPNGTGTPAVIAFPRPTRWAWPTLGRGAPLSIGDRRQLVTMLSGAPSFAQALVKAMRARLAVQMAEGCRAAFGALEPLIEPISVALADVALADAFVALATAIARDAATAAPFDVIVALPVSGVDTAHVTALLTAVEAIPCAWSALLDLGAIEDGAPEALLHIGERAALDVAVAAALAPMANGVPAPLSFVLRRPLADAELNDLLTAADAIAATPATISALKDRIEAAAAAQVFGPGNHPSLKILRGGEPPQDHPVTRAR